MADHEVFDHVLEPLDGPSIKEDRIKKVLHILDEGVLSLVEYLDQHKLGDAFIDDLEHCLQFILQMQEWCGKMPVSRLEEAALTLIKNLFVVSFQALEIEPAEFQKDQNDDFPGKFLIKATDVLGPELVVSNDRMSAMIRVPEILLMLWTPERIISVLNQMGIRTGIDRGAIESIFLPEKKDQLVRVARGKAPVPGQDAVIIDRLGLERQRHLSEFDLQKANYREILDFKPVKSGQIIYEKTALTDGEPGFDVFGEPVSSISGLDEDLPMIEHCDVTQDLLSLVSSVDGCAYLKDDQLIVVPALLIDGNLDYAIGNIRTEVAVSVKKNVLSDFHIHSKSDIGVEGVVEGANLKANGNLFCKGGVNGKSKAVLQAGQSCYAKYLNESKVIAGHMVCVNNSIIHCQVQARRVSCLGRDAEMIGGKIIAWDDICADVIGSEAGVNTELILGAELPSLRRKVEMLRHQVQQKNDEKEKLEHYRLKLNPENRELVYCPPESQNKLKKIYVLIKQANQQLDQLKLKLNEAENDLVSSEKGIRMVRARKTIHVGAVIKVLEQTMKINVSTGPVSIVYEDGKLVKKAYMERDDLSDEP